MPQQPKNRPEPLPQTDAPPGQRIARLRKLQGFSQEALAEKMGISRKQITDYETGRVHLNDEMIVRFAVTLKVSTDQLLGLKAPHTREEAALRYTRRLRALMDLPESRKRTVLKVLDDLIRANS
jgi:transcriptional regulator with XRE-family HTH domain